MPLFRFLPERSREPLPDFGVRYLQHVLAEYATLPPGAKANIPAEVQAILNKATASPPAEMTWGDLFVLEKTLLTLQPEATIRRRAWGIRGSYRELFGQKQYEVYLASNPPNENEPGSKIEDVRADLERLLDALHWSYALIPILERMRHGLIRFIGNWVFWGASVLLLFAWWATTGDQTLVATLLLLMIAGAAGGFVSLLQRIQNMPSVDPLISIFELQNGRFSLYLAPISGAIFAVVLYFIFLGRLVTGVIFPEHVTPFHLHWGPAADQGWAADPMTYWDFGKLVVWCFIAGFAERFVPDTLDRLVNRAREAQGPNPVPAAPPPPFGQGAQLSLTATAGDGQSTAVNTRFKDALQATVTDTSNKPVPNAKVTFSAPATGPSGTFASDPAVTTDAQGIAIAPEFTANQMEGAFSVTAVTPDSKTEAKFNLTNTGPASHP